MSLLPLFVLVLGFPERRHDELAVEPSAVIDAITGVDGLTELVEVPIRKEEREEYRERLKTLGLGLENRMTAKVGLLSGGQRQAVTLLMASLREPKLLLLDEHTAALDPATAEKVLELSDQIVAEHNLTTLMITHNMTDAIQHGNRLIMMNDGEIILDVRGEEKKHLTRRELIDKFAALAGTPLETDAVLLS